MIDGKKPSLEGVLNNAHKNISLTDEDRENLKLLEAAEVKYDEEIKPLEVALETFDEYGGTRVIGTLGNFSVVTGKAKARKTFFISTALAAAIGDKELLGCIRGCLTHDIRNVILIDTEMARQSVQLLLHRICNQIGVEKPDNLKVYSLRKYSPSKRTSLIETRLKVSENLGFVAIDGIRDLISNINDGGESMDLISNLLRWTEEYNIHIMTVLHLNKGDSNLRGHIGSEAMNKAETVIEIEKNGDYSMVKSKESRNLDIEPIVFGIDENELPFAVEDQASILSTFGENNGKPTYTTKTAIKSEQLIEIFKGCYTSNEGIKRNDLVPLIQEQYLKVLNVKLGITKAKELISRAHDEEITLQKVKNGEHYLSVV